MRYENIAGSPMLLPEKSATIKNIDANNSVKIKAITDKASKIITLFPGQKMTYVNATVYLWSLQKGALVRVGILPVKLGAQGEDDGSVNVDLSGYATLADLSNYATLTDTAVASVTDINKIVAGLYNSTNGGE